MPWSCPSCEAEANDRLSVCPECGYAKSAWTVVADITRAFAISRKHFDLLHEIAQMMLKAASTAEKISRASGAVVRVHALTLVPTSSRGSFGERTQKSGWKRSLSAPVSSNTMWNLWVCCGRTASTVPRRTRAAARTSVSSASSAAARAAGFGSTIHAGEDPSSSGIAANVRTAVEAYGATRIGHGYATLTDDSVLGLTQKRGIHFECCPTSSYLTGGFGPRPIAAEAPHLGIPSQ